MMDFLNYGDSSEKKPQKFRITRGMLILAILAIILLVIIIIVIVNALGKQEKYTDEDWKKLEERMVEEAPIYIEQKKLVLTSEKIRIDLKDLLEENGGTINSSKVKAAKICEGYVLAYKTESAQYESYIKCKDLYVTSGYESNNFVTTKSSTTKKDAVKPEIILNGESEITIIQGGSYTEPGAKATDNVDGDITSSVKITGKVDTNKVGTYSIKYTVTDKAGNKAEKTRKVIVKKADVTTTKPNQNQTTKPQTTSSPTTKPSISSPPRIYLNGNRTITIEQGNSYNEPGYSAKDYLGRDITGRVRVSGSVNTRVSGTYVLTYSVTDYSGKSSSITRTVIVKSTYIALKGISLSPNSISLGVGASRQITVYYNPSNASNKTITWSSSNPSVATVSNGQVFARSRGTATITARAADGKTASAIVNVN